MKLKLYTAAALIATAALASCAGDDNKDYVDKSIIPTAEEKAAAAQNAVTSTTAPVNPANAAMPVNLQQQTGNTITMPGGKTLTVPGTGPIAITPVPAQANAVPQNNMVMTQNPQAMQPTAPGMNPPHGQPGHRCDIAVGVPLNSKPAPATTTGTTVAAQPQVTMKEIANTTKTAPGMNPPHGEPGHRCDIAVGAPLNSKPAPVATTGAPATIAPPPLLVPAKADSTKN